MKKYNCERCGREIRGKGRCLPCNYFYKHKKYFPGLRESPDYDKERGIELEFAKRIIEERKFFDYPKKRQRKMEDLFKKEYKYKKLCKICNCEFQTDKEYETCFNCYRFFMKFGGIESYQQFLEAFELLDSENSKNNYIEFIDRKNQFSKIREIWTVEKILANPRKFLDRVKEK